jgi:hypothetical protein
VFDAPPRIPLLSGEDEVIESTTALDCPEIDAHSPGGIDRDIDMFPQGDPAAELDVDVID